MSGLDYNYNVIKRYKITSEEFEAIKEAIENVLNLYQFDVIGAENETGAKISMNKETFFRSLEDEFIIIDNE